MRKIIFLILLFPLVFAACRKKNEACNPNTYKYTFKSNVQVDTLRHAAGSPLVTVVNPGSKLVFTYNYYFSPCDMVIDGGGGETLVFEVDPMATSFNYFTSDFVASNCYLQRVCEICSPRDVVMPSSGTIEGTLVNGQWNVHADLKFNTLSPGILQFSGVFTPAP